MSRHAICAVACLLTGAFVAGCMPTEEPAVQVDPTRARIDARTTLLGAADSGDALAQIQAMEALAGTLGSQAGGVYKQNLRSENPAVQFAAAMAAGESRYQPAMPLLLEKAKAAGPDKRVYTAVIYALHRLGDDTYTGDLARLMDHREKEVRAQAALVIGRIGDPSGAGLLEDQLRREPDPGVQFQITEALALLGDEGSAQRLEAYTKGYFIDLRLAAIPSLVRAGTPNAALILSELRHDKHPRVRVAAAGSLARLGQAPPQAYDEAVRCLRAPREVIRESFPDAATIGDVQVSSLQVLAARALGHMRRLAAVDVLHPYLQSEDGQVRVAAAMSILRLLEDHSHTAPRAEEKAAAPLPEPVEPESPRADRPKLHRAGAKD